MICTAMTMPLASFDVFDTVLTRSVGTPASMFLLLGRRLNRRGAITCSAEAFARARANAQKLARLHQPSGEITLTDIYRQLGAALGLDARQQLQMAEEEQRLEAELIRPVPGAQRWLDVARQNGHPVRFVSDMYLSHAFIEKQLQSHALWATTDRCYVSGEVTKNKTTGALFTEMLRIEQTKPHASTHTGNDWHSDVIAARRLGLCARYQPQANLNRYEQSLDSRGFETEGLSSLLAGASRMARLQYEAVDESARVRCEVAAGVAAPLLIGYVLWVLRRAMALKLSRLYFVSRDGQILLKVAQILAPKLGIPVALQYLYGSRQAWNQPAILQLDDTDWFWILRQGHQLSVEQVLQRAGLNSGEMQTQLLELGIPRSAWGRPAGPEQLTALAELLGRADIRDRILARATDSRRLLTEYLEQEGLLRDTDWALVDTGWYGRTERSLSRVLGLNGHRPARAFYIGYLGSESEARMGRHEAYLQDVAAGLGFAPQVPHLASLVEMFCRADHGMVLGYQRGADGRIQPKLKSAGRPLAGEFDAVQYQKVISLVAAELCLNEELTNPWADLRPAIVGLIEQLWMSPLPVEARVWGRLNCDTDQGDICCQIARPYRWRNLWRGLRHGRVVHEDYSFWPAGSWAITSPVIRLGLNGMMALHRLARHLIAPIGRAKTTGAIPCAR